MNSKQVSFVLCCLIAGVAANSLNGYNKKLNDLYVKSKTLTVGSEQCLCASPSSTVSTTASTTTEASTQSTPKSGSSEIDEVISCGVPLMDYLLNVSYSLASSSDSEVYTQWMMDIQSEILCDQSLSDDQKLLQVICSMKEMLNENPELSKEIQYVNMGDLGYVSDFLSIDVEYEMSSIDDVMAWDGQSIPLFDAILNDTSFTSSEITTLKAFFAEASSEIFTGEYNSTQESALLYTAFMDFMAKNPAIKSKILKVKVDGYGCFESWLSYGKMAQGLYLQELYIDAMMAEMDAFIHNSSIDVGVRLQMKQFYDSWMAYCSTHTKEECLAEYSRLLLEFQNIAGFDIKYILGMTFCIENDGVETCMSGADLAAIAYMQSKYDLEVIIIIKTSTASTPSTSPTTSKVPSTTVNPLYICSNESISYWFTESSQYNGMSPFAYYANQSLYSSSISISCKSALSPVSKRIHAIIVNSTTNGSSSTFKANGVFSYLAKQPTNNVVCQRYFLNYGLYIDGVYWGRICDLAACTQNTNANLSCSL